MFKILMLLAALAAGSKPRIDSSTVPSLTSDVATSAVAVGASFERAQLLATMAACESAGSRKVRGDNGLACGRCQLHAEWREEHSCEELEAKGSTLDLELWLRGIDFATEKCGSLARGLGLMATGKCGGAPMLVARRLSGTC